MWHNDIVREKIFKTISKQAWDHSQLILLVVDGRWKTVLFLENCSPFLLLSLLTSAPSWPVMTSFSHPLGSWLLSDWNMEEQREEQHDWVAWQAPSLCKSPELCSSVWPFLPGLFHLLPDLTIQHMRCPSLPACSLSCFPVMWPGRKNRLSRVFEAGTWVCSPQCSGQEQVPFD